MIAKRILYALGGIACATLAIIIHILSMPVAMAFAAVDAMADTVDKAAEQIKDSLKS